MLDFTGAFVDDHHPGIVAIFGRMGSNKTVGQVEFEFR